MKVWELMVALSRAPANSEVLISRGEASFKIDDVTFHDWNIEGFINQYPVNLTIRRKDG